MISKRFFLELIKETKDIEELLEENTTQKINKSMYSQTSLQQFEDILNNEQRIDKTDILCIKHGLKLYDQYKHKDMNYKFWVNSKKGLSWLSIRLNEIIEKIKTKKWINRRWNENF